MSRTSTSSPSSKRFPCFSTALFTKPLPGHRFREALLDPKTWLFALFSAVNNVPNSLTNQRQIIVSSFGFTALQTTLLGCVDGMIEIVTIYVGVTVVAKVPNSRAIVGAVWFVPNLVGVLLINLLPWSNKVGLLFAQWTTGAWCLLQFTGNRES